MKKITKMLVLALALVVSLSLGAGSTAEAASKATKLTSVDKLTESNKIVLTKGKKATLVTVETLKNGQTKKDSKAATFKSSNKKVATVSSKGVITATGKGKATITVTSKLKNAKGKKITKKVKVTVVTGKIKTITMNKKTATVKVGKTVDVVAKIKATGSKPNAVLKWTANNANATVALKTTAKNNKKSTATVTGVKAGTVKINAKSTDGTNKKAKTPMTVTVEGYTVTPNAKATGKAEVKVVYTSAADLQKDLDALAAAGVVADGTFTVTIGKDTYTAKVANKTVTVNGKKLDNTKANKQTEVTVTVNVKPEKLLQLAVFAPKSIKSITVAGTTITDITADSFKIGTTTLGYAVTAKSKDLTINAADGDVVTAFAGLTKAGYVEVK